MLSGAAAGPSKSTNSSDVLSPAYRAIKQLELTQQTNAAKHDCKVKPEQECVGSIAGGQRSHRQNKSIAAAHPAIYLNTRSHKLLRRAVRIWKMPVPILNFTGSSKPKPRNFQEQLKRVEMLRNQSGDNLKPTARSVRDMQLCSSGTDSSPSPSTSSESPCKRTAHVYRTRRYRRQLRWYRMLSHNKRCKQGDEKLHRLEYQDDRRDSSSTQSTPVIRAPARKTSRRLWRRQLDSSSSDSSPMTANPVNKSSVRHTPAAHGTDKQRKHKRVSFSFPEESKTSNCSWTEFDVLDGISNFSNEASASKPAVQTTEKLTPQTSLKITATNMEELNSPHLQFDSEASLVSQMKIFKDELKHCEDIKQQTISLQIKTPSSFASRHSQTNTDALQKADTPRPKSCVKWKSVLLQRAQCSASAPTFTPADCSTPEGGSDADRPDKKQSSAEDQVESSSSGDSLIPQ
ncbi:hypothetical protein ABG768_003147 [Culter alburnus]|uniref:Uncharacterized protein n=1 Tax=Culter alburnus TaxID=194366 RepID=A0AAW2A801_CULAL